MIKNKRQVFIILLFIMFFYSADFALALEINYPQIPGLPKITDNSGFPDYVGYFFTLGTYLAGALALMSFAVGAVQMIMSAGNPTTAGDAKGRMMGSILGLVLTISAFLILKTINPTLIIPTLTPLPGVAGVFYTNGTDFKPAETSREEARNKIGIHGNILLSVGRLVPWKGFRMLIKIMPQLLEINQFFRLVHMKNDLGLGIKHCLHLKLSLNRAKSQNLFL